MSVEMFRAPSYSVEINRHKYQGLGHLARSVPRVTAALANVVYQAGVLGGPHGLFFVVISQLFDVVD